MKTIELIAMVAILLEGLVEYGKTIMYMVEDEEYKTAVIQGITIALGIALSFVFGTELFNNALSEMYEGLSINPVVDMALTGILFSRGSNYFNDFIDKVRKRKRTSENDDDDDYESEDYEDEFTDEGEAE